MKTPRLWARRKTGEEIVDIPVIPDEFDERV